MKVNTNLMKNMLSHVAKCKPSSLLEITNYYEIKVQDNILYLTATDGTNYVVAHQLVEADDMCVIVKADQFTKLITKTTTEDIQLNIVGNALEVKGNGVYRVEIVEDETYPFVTMNTDDSFKVNSKDLKDALSACKNAKSQSAADGVLYSYLMRGDNILTADAIKVCEVKIKGEGMEDVNLLISPTLAILLSSLDKEMATVNIDNEKQLIQFVGEHVIITGPIVEGADQYPDLSELMGATYPMYCEIDTQELLQALDRLNLFVGIYDKNIVTLSFVDNTMSIITSTNSIETLTSKVEGGADKAVYSINGKYFQDLISSVSNPTVLIEYGLEDTIRIDSSNALQLLAIVDE